MDMLPFPNIKMCGNGQIDKKWCQRVGALLAKFGDFVANATLSPTATWGMMMTASPRIPLCLSTVNNASSSTFAQTCNNDNNMGLFLAKRHQNWERWFSEEKGLCGQYNPAERETITIKPNYQILLPRPRGVKFMGDDPAKGAGSQFNPPCNIGGGIRLHFT